jgi:glyoxylase-like metal-dependent hydrolase (beta-lactamase superfamily II)
MFGLRPIPAPRVDGYLDERSGLPVGGLRLEVRRTPGHAPGHVSLVAGALDYEGRTVPAAFVGDVIFLGSIGRTDLVGGDYETLMTSIEQQILSLPEETVLFSGHGPATTVGHERRYNPFVQDWQRDRKSGG